MKILLAFALTVACAVSIAQTTKLEHKSGSTTTVKTTKDGSDVTGKSKNGGQPSGTEKNTAGHKENVERVKAEGKAKGDPVTKVNGKSVPK